MRNFSKSITLITFFTVVLNVFSVLLIMEPAKAAPGDAGDILSSNTTGAYSSHEIFYDFVTTPEVGDTFSITFPNEFNCSGLTIGDVTSDNNWSVTAAGYINVDGDIVCAINLLAGVGPGYISVTIADSITNPVNWGNYSINLRGSREPSNWITFKVQIADDRLDNNAKGEYSGHHVSYAFLGDPALNDTFTITLPDDFDCSILTTDHARIENSDGWSLTSAGPVGSTCQIVATATSVNPKHDIQVIFGYDEYMINPTNAGNYEITLEGSYEPSPPVYLTIPILTSQPTDITSSDLVGAKSSHQISFDFATAPAEGDTFKVVFPRFSGYGDERYHCSGLVSGDFTLSNGWAVDSIDTATCTIIFSASLGASNPIDISISESHLLNPEFAWGGISISLLGSAEPNPAPFIIHNITFGGSGDGTDTMSDNNPGEYSSHNISYELIYPSVFSLRTITVTFPNGFDCTGIQGTDITEQPGWVFSIPTEDTCEILATPVDPVDDEHLISSNPLIINIADDIIKNPLLANYYNLSIVSSNYGGYYDGLYPAVSIPVTIGTLGELAAGMGSDTMSSLTVGENSSHLISYHFNENPVENDTFTIIFPAGFDCTGLTTDDVTANTGWTVTSATPETCIVVLTADASPTNPIEVTIASTHMINPTDVEVYNIVLSSSEGTKTLQVPIVDSDTVDINALVLSNVFFDIDTGTGEIPEANVTPPVDCDASGDYACSIFEYGPPGENYTVDLGHLTMAYVNKSNTDAVMHSNDDNELINSIYFDISTNAASGVVLTYKSLYGELRGPGHNILATSDSDIPTVADGSTQIEQGVSAYGIQMYADPVYKSKGGADPIVNCGTAPYYCVMGEINPTTGVNEQTFESIYTATGPIELGRGRIDVAAAIDGTVVPGNYEDYITFIATSIF